MTTDTLSELLRAVRLRGAAFHRGAPGANAAPPLERDERAMQLHWLANGALVVLPDAARAGAVPPPAAHVVGEVRYEGRALHPLVATLPPVVRLDAGPDTAWLGCLMEQAAQECAVRRPGGDALVERLAETLFVDVLRRAVATLPAEDHRWLPALRDRFVGRALAALHERPDHPWTVDELGRRVGLSRSALYERFSQSVGVPPSQYLAQWRIQLGSRLLRETPRTVASIAQDVGYDSEAAFCRAFKRLVGQPPAMWRRLQAAPAAAA
jgi:AraC-like DNA-binding protein